MVFFLQTAMYYMDIFKSPLTLLFARKRFISTNFGFLCSLGIISTLIIMVVNSDLFSKSLPQILTSNLPLISRPLIKFNKKILAVGVQDDTYFQGLIDPSIYTLKVTNLFYSSNSTGGYVRNSSEKQLHPCSEKDFDDPTIFSNLGLTNNYCFNREDNDFEFKGFFDEPSVNFAIIELFLCNNATYNNKCKTFDEIRQNLNGKSFNIYFEDSIFDTANYINPVKKTITNRYEYIDVFFRKNIDLNFQKITLKSDDGWFFGNWTSYSEIGFSSQNSDIFTVSSNDLNTSRFAINMYSDKNSVVIQRLYIKVSDLLARLGGVLQSLMFIGYILIHFEHSLYLKNTILNALYSFQKKGTEKNRKKSIQKLPFNNLIQKGKTEKIMPSVQQFEGFSMIFPASSTRFIDMPSGKPMGKSIIGNLFKTSFNFFKKKALEFYEFKMESPEKLKFGLLNYFILKIKSKIPYLKLTHEEKLFSKSEKIYEKEVDYIEILKKLQEIDKLKQILLNHHQQVLFKFLSKPILRLNDMGNSKEIKDFSINLDAETPKFDDLRETLNFYENVKLEKGITDIDERLLEVVRQDIQKLK